MPALTRQARDKVGDTLRRLSPDARICDIGAGGRKITPSTFTIDGFVSDNTSLTCDIHHIPLPDGSFDAIFCTGTLEHVVDPRAVMAEIYRLLSPEGIVHIEVPFIQGFHADPQDFWRWTGDGLRLFCTGAGFSEIESGSHMGPTSALNWILNEYIICLFGNGFIGNAASAAARFVMAPLTYLDRHLVRKGYAMRIASGIYFVGRK